MTDPSTPPAPPPYSDHGAPGNTDAARIAAETMRRTAEQAAHEQMRAGFRGEHAPPITFGSRVQVVAKDDAACVDYGTVLDTAPGGWKVVTDQGMADDYPLADVRPLSPEADAFGDTPRPGNRVVLVMAGRVMPLGSLGEVMEEHESGAVIVRFDGSQVEMGYRPSDLRVIREAPETVMERLRKRMAAAAREAREAPPPGWTPMSAGTYAAPRPYAPSCCGPTACGPACAEEDDSVTDDLRDLVTPQVLAMTTARTKQGVATAAVAILMAARGDVLIDSVTRGLRRVLGAAGDLLDGIDLDALGRQVVEQMGVPVAPKAAPAKPAGEGQSIDIGVQVDGKTVGVVTVPVFATEADVARVIQGDALLLSKIPDGCPVDVVYVPGKVVRITTRPATAPESGTVG